MTKTVKLKRLFFIFFIFLCCQPIMGSSLDLEYWIPSTLKKGDIELIKAYLETVLKKQSFIYRKVKFKQLFFEAVRYGQLEIVKYLFSKGAQVNYKERFYEWRPLHIASQNGYVEIANFLISKGAKINEQAGRSEHYSYNETPLHMAVQAKKIDMVKFLLLNGADKNIKNSFGKTPLELAKGKSSKEIIELLQKAEESQSKANGK